MRGKAALYERPVICDRGNIARLTRLLRFGRVFRRYVWEDQVQKLARSLVTLHGMSEEFGLRLFRG